MEPRELADEAFLRRIPYKIHITYPTENKFRDLFRREAAQHEIDYNERAVDELIETHYVKAGRPLRCCHARDLLRQIRHYCQFKGYPVEMTTEHLNVAVRNYFGTVG